MKEKIDNLKKIVAEERKIINEIKNISNELEKADKEEKNMLSSQLKKLEHSLKKNSQDLKKDLYKINLIKPLNEKKRENFKKNSKIPKFKKKTSNAKLDIPKIEITTLKRLKKRKEKITEAKIKKPSTYIKLANKFFSDSSRSLLKAKRFLTVERNLIKTNLEFTPTSYISLILFTTCLVGIACFFVFLFFVFFDLSAQLPIIVRSSESIGSRILEFFWMIFIFPLGAFLFTYFYPSLEKRSLAYQIEQELPFATIHMAAISGSMIEPSKIFQIMTSTKEYPYIEREFTKLINEINIYGYDLVTAMRSIAMRTPSNKLAELLKGLATTINSGGNLQLFFEKRSQNLLFEYKLEREKYTKTAETFMDIYISVVIAAPMILMLLLMMIRISGLGISLSSSAITLLMVVGVSFINIVFLAFLHLKQPK